MPFTDGVRVMLKVRVSDDSVDDAVGVPWDADREAVVLRDESVPLLVPDGEGVLVVLPVDEYVGDAVPLKDGTWVRDSDPLGVGVGDAEGVRVALPVQVGKLGVVVGDLVGVQVAERDDAEALHVPVQLALCERLRGDGESVRDDEGDGVRVQEQLPVGEEPLNVKVGVPLRDRVPDCVRVAVGVRTREYVRVAVHVDVGVLVGGV